MKQRLVTSLKVLVSAGLVAYLVFDAVRHGTFSALRGQSIEWGPLGLAFLVCFAAVCVTIVRWRLLVEAVGIPFRLPDAFRLGLLGYLLNFISLGSVGGDLFKAVLLAREQKGRREAAVASVLLDRILGLYGLLLVASCAIGLSGVWRRGTPQIRIICQGATLAALIATVGLTAVFALSGKAWLWAPLERLRFSGHTWRRLRETAQLYRSQPQTLLLAIVMSMGTHALLATGLALISRALPGQGPTIGEHFVIVPLAMVTGAIPLPLGALGALEGALEYLYAHVSAVGVEAGKGLLVAIGYRAVTIAIAAVGACYYAMSRRELGEAMKTAEREIAEAEEPVGGTA